MKDIYTGRVTSVQVGENSNLAAALEIVLADGRQGTIPIDMLGFALPIIPTGRHVAKRFVGRYMAVKMLQDDPLVLSNAAAVDDIKARIDLKIGDIIEAVVVGIGNRELKLEYRKCMLMTLPSSEYGIANKTNYKYTGVYFGAILKAEVIGIEDAGQIIVSRKRIIAEEWRELAESYKKKGQYLATVVNKIREGVFVKLPQGLDILCSPMPDFDLNQGDEVSIEIRKINVDTGRIKAMIICRAAPA